MERILMSVIALALTLGSYAARAAGDSKAAELLAQARAAIGGEQQIARVQGLSCSGTAQRTIGDRQVSGDLTIDLQLPDKMLRTESISPMGDTALVVTEQGVNGDIMLRHTRLLNMPAGAMVRTPPPPAPGSEAEAQAVRNSRAELARLTMALLVASPASLPVEFTYAGEAEAPDGKADVLDARGAGGFAAKLFLDKSTHRPLMLAYRGVAPRIVVQTQRVEGTPPPSAGAGHEPAGAATPDAVDITMFFDDYRSVDGVSLPHRITRAVGAETNEEWTFKAIKVNPTFTPDTFARK